ncbi:hypothetical protein C8R46DRAFT_1218956 [Mycena filopes]|nr:hypothetical protein C8R46DRAFT_1218956 [Mycena filopes]
MKGCDNMECGQLRVKSDFKRCSGCFTLYYCDDACQRLDWQKGGHRNDCGVYRAQYIRDSHLQNLTRRELSFLRALVHQDFEKNRPKILVQQAAHMRLHSNKSFLTLYNYVLGAPNIDVHPVVGPQVLKFLGGGAGSAWERTVARAAASGGRMWLDVVALNAGGGIRAALLQRIVPELPKNPAQLRSKEMQAISSRHLGSKVRNAAVIHSSASV